MYMVIVSLLIFKYLVIFQSLETIIASKSDSGSCVKKSRKESKSLHMSSSSARVSYESSEESVTGKKVSKDSKIIRELRARRESRMSQLSDFQTSSSSSSSVDSGEEPKMLRSRTRASKKELRREQTEFGISDTKDKVESEGTGLERVGLPFHKFHDSDVKTELAKTVKEGTISDDESSSDATEKIRKTAKRKSSSACKETKSHSSRGSSDDSSPDQKSQSPNLTDRQTRYSSDFTEDSSTGADDEEKSGKERKETDSKRDETSKVLWVRSSSSEKSDILTGTEKAIGDTMFLKQSHISLEKMLSSSSIDEDIQTEIEEKEKSSFIDEGLLSEIEEKEKGKLSPDDSEYGNGSLKGLSDKEKHHTESVLDMKRETESKVLVGKELPSSGSSEKSDTGKEFRERSVLKHSKVGQEMGSLSSPSDDNSRRKIIDWLKQTGSPKESGYEAESKKITVKQEGASSDSIADNGKEPFDKNIPGEEKREESVSEREKMALPSLKKKIPTSMSSKMSDSASEKAASLNETTDSEHSVVVGTRSSKRSSRDVKSRISGRSERKLVSAESDNEFQSTKLKSSSSSESSVESEKTLAEKSVKPQVNEQLVSRHGLDKTRIEASQKDSRISLEMRSSNSSTDSDSRKSFRRKEELLHKDSVGSFESKTSKVKDFAEDKSSGGSEKTGSEDAVKVKIKEDLIDIHELVKTVKEEFVKPNQLNSDSSEGSDSVTRRADRSDAKRKMISVKKEVVVSSCCNHIVDITVFQYFTC